MGIELLTTLSLISTFTKLFSERENKKIIYKVLKVNFNSLKFVALLFLGLCLLPISPVHANQYKNLLQKFQEQEPDKFYTDHLISLKQELTPQIASITAQVTLPPANQMALHHFFTPDPEFLQLLKTKNLAKNFSNISGSDLELKTVLTFVSLRNLKIKASQKMVDASRQSIRQATNLDAILKQYAAFTASLANKIGPMKGSMVQEKFPFPALASLKGRIAGQNVIISLEKLEITRRSVLTSSQKQFWDLFYIREAQKLNKKMINLLEHLETVARSRYETGKAGFQELIQVQITLETLKVKQITLRESQESIETKLKQLLNLPKISNIGAPSSKYFKAPESEKIVKNSLPKLNILAQTFRQELRIERAAITKTELLIDLAESMILPPLTLNLANFSNKAIQHTASQSSFKVGVKAQKGAGLPKSPWFGTNDAFLVKTRHLLAAKKENLHNLELETRAIIRERWFKLDLARRDVELYRNKIVDLSQAALEVVTQGYETGETPFAQVNLSYQNWLNSRLTLVRRISDRGIAKSRLAESLGSAQF